MACQILVDPAHITDAQCGEQESNIADLTHRTRHSFAGFADDVVKLTDTGKYAIEGSLDLHRLTVKEARAEILRFFDLARAKQWRTLLIAHGRGEKSQPPARLKSYVACWLNQVPDIIAFHSADKRHGGTGAVLVLLKKTRKAKEETREKYGLKTDTTSGNDRS